MTTQPMAFAWDDRGRMRIAATRTYAAFEGGHGGSRPHLVNEFPSALREDLDPWHNAVVSANWICVGICAHESATKSGEIVRLPGSTLAT